MALSGDRLRREGHVGSSYLSVLEPGVVVRPAVRVVHVVVRNASFEHRLLHAQAQPNDEEPQRVPTAARGKLHGLVVDHRPNPRLVVRERSVEEEQCACCTGSGDERRC